MTKILFFFDIYACSSYINAGLFFRKAPPLWNFCLSEVIYVMRYM